MTAKAWAVVEFDEHRDPIWSSGPFTEEQARERFAYVTKKRSQRSDVVLRARSAALLHRGKVVEACSIRRSRREPMLGNNRLLHLDVDVREQIIGLELMATRLARISLRQNGTHRVGPGWSQVRRMACEIWTLVRGRSAVPVYGSVDVWWLQEWTCGCSQVEHSQAALHDQCPYHAAPAAHPAVEFLGDGDA